MFNRPVATGRTTQCSWPHAQTSSRSVVHIIITQMSRALSCVHWFVRGQHFYVTWDYMWFIRCFYQKRLTISAFQTLCPQSITQIQEPNHQKQRRLKASVPVGINGIVTVQRHLKYIVVCHKVYFQALYARLTCWKCKRCNFSVTS